MDRSHQGRVQCTRTITIVCLIFEFLPFVYFHPWFLSGAYLQNCIGYGYEILWVDRCHQGGVQCTWTVTLACLIFDLLPFVVFHNWILPLQLGVRRAYVATICRSCYCLNSCKKQFKFLTGDSRHLSEFQANIFRFEKVMAEYALAIFWFVAFGGGRLEFSSISL